MGLQRMGHNRAPMHENQFPKLAFFFLNRESPFLIAVTSCRGSSVKLLWVLVTRGSSSSVKAVP